jgi:hypothetical protein
MPKCTPRLIYVEHTTWYAFKESNEWKWCYGHFEYVVMPFGLTNEHVVFQHLTMYFMNTLMILWFLTLMTSSFFQRIWMTMNTMYAWFWRTSWKLDFMPNWRNVSSINLKCNFWVTTFLEMPLTWIFIRFRPFSTGLLQLLFEMSNVF